MKLIHLLLLVLLNSVFFAQDLEKSHTLSGFVYDADNGETMIGANIFIKELGTGTS